ncbi:FMN hydrolase/5-amino-6-(5-phospho-D-ribitylamino)uracil phosphatase [Enterococcus sp. 665A]|uniref:FMN hydrolase/5-amino-6-(5-phospho-D-ribitylamino)uracil phosphatase n=1 Tax=Candidatus Enterococcus ferrettii TaxID=2815324 RepID=A0ABV0EKX9_9ENTE
MAALTDLLAGDLIPVSSGHGDIDLIIPGVHKAYGLSKLCKAWAISSSELAAFGDSGNDIEMLEYAGFSFAMENAQPAVKKTAVKVIGTNNQESVFDIIEALLLKV